VASGEYGFGILNAGKKPALLASALSIAGLGFACARLLRPTRPAEPARSRRAAA
jgi:hypothetical protein